MAESQGISVEELQKRDAEMREKGIERQLTSIYVSVLKMWLQTQRIVRNTVAAIYNYTLGSICSNSISYKTAPELLDIQKILREIVQIHGYEILIDGCFNGDPHPGNILLLKDGRYGLIDYGQVKRINRDECVNLAKLIIALSDRDRN